MKHYGKIIMYINRLKNGLIHENAMKDVKKFIKKGYDEQKFINVVPSKNRHVFEAFWHNSEETNAAEDKTS